MKAEYRLCLGSCTIHVYRGLQAEERQPAPQKGRVTLRFEDECLIVTIEASDLTGLRALSNSFLLLVHAAYRTLLEAGVC